MLNVPFVTVKFDAVTLLNVTFNAITLLNVEFEDVMLELVTLLNVAFDATTKLLNVRLFPTDCPEGVALIIWTMAWPVESA